MRFIKKHEIWQKIIKYNHHLLVESNQKIASSFNWDKNASRILMILLGGFFLSKLLSLNVPFFHDELGVYGKAIFYMIDNGPTIIPGDVDPIISRGHPLFFIFFVSSCTSLLGGSYISARLVILMISVGLLLTTYFLGKELASKKVGLIAVFLFIFQPIFFAQSTLVLPEIFLSFLGSITILFYLRKNYGMYFLFGSMLILTKETAIVVFAGIVLNEWYKEKFRINWNLILRSVKYSLPIICLVVFLIVQKIQHGWFLYPYHTGFISFSASDIYNRLWACLKHFFLDQNRSLMLIPLAFSLFKASKGDFKKFVNTHSLSFFVGLMMFSFSGLNYFMSRYLLLIYPLFFLAMVHIFESKKTPLVFYFIYFLITVVFFHYQTEEFRTDDEMSYAISVLSLKKGIDELDRISQGDSMNVHALFPSCFALEDTRYGYTNNPNYKIFVKYKDSVDYIIRGRHTIYSKKKHQEEKVYLLKKDRKTFSNSWTAIDTLLYNKAALKQSAIEQVYGQKYYFHDVRIFKTNNKKVPQ